MLADHRGGLSSSGFLAWSSIAQSVCQRVFGLLTIWCLGPRVQILPSAEEHNVSPFDLNIACLCQSIEINNNKKVCLSIKCCYIAVKRHEHAVCYFKHHLSLNISVETWTQRVWHQVYKMYRVLKQCEYHNNQWLVWVWVGEFKSLVAVIPHGDKDLGHSKVLSLADLVLLFGGLGFVLGVYKTLCAQCILRPNRFCNI